MFRSIHLSNNFIISSKRKTTHGNEKEWIGEARNKNNLNDEVLAFHLFQFSSNFPFTVLSKPDLQINVGLAPWGSSLYPLAGSSRVPFQQAPTLYPSHVLPARAHWINTKSFQRYSMILRRCLISGNETPLQATSQFPRVTAI